MGGSFIMGIQFSAKKGFTFDLLGSVGAIAMISSVNTTPPHHSYYPYYSPYFYHPTLLNEYPLLNLYGLSAPYFDYRLALNLGYRF